MEGFALREEQSNELGMATCLSGLALATVNLDAAREAAHALGAVEAWLERTLRTLELPDRASYDLGLTAVRHALGDVEFAQELSIGRGMSLPDVVNEMREAFVPGERRSAELAESEEERVCPVVEEPPAALVEMSELTIAIDGDHQARQVASIVETEYFQTLRQQARELRQARGDG